MNAPVVGRLAPSPTGVLHVGNARSLVAAWLSARSVGGKVLLRIEDLLPGQPEKVASVLEDLRYLGLDWDPPPPEQSCREPSDFDVDLPGNTPFWLQSARSHAYDAESHALIAAGSAYPCVCTRKDIERALRAPHAEERGAAYPGTCRGRFADLAAAVRWEGALASRLGRRPVGAALRLRAEAGQTEVQDGFAGAAQIDVAGTFGDFVIRRKDGLHAYMFAVVLDDIAMGVTEIVRGDDLLECTAQQFQVAVALADHSADESVAIRAREAPPRFMHIPLVYGDDGRRLAKRDASIHVRALQEEGVPAERLRRWIAVSLGLAATGDLEAMAAAFDWERVPRWPVRFGADDLHALLTAGAEYCPVARKADISGL